MRANVLRHIRWHCPPADAARARPHALDGDAVTTTIVVTCTNQTSWWLRDTEPLPVRVHRHEPAPISALAQGGTSGVSVGSSPELPGCGHAEGVRDHWRSTDEPTTVEIIVHCGGGDAWSGFDVQAVRMREPGDGRKFGRWCPLLARRGHGCWYVNVELSPARDAGRRRLRRGEWVRVCYRLTAAQAARRSCHG